MENYRKTIIFEWKLLFFLILNALRNANMMDSYVIFSKKNLFYQHGHILKNKNGRSTMSSWRSTQAVLMEWGFSAFLWHSAQAVL